MSRTRIYSVASMLFMLVAPLHAHAHLMVEQLGTINIVDDGAFVVVSVPVAAFSGIDDDGDGLASASELRSHYEQVSSEVQRRLQLSSGSGPRPLQGLLINSANDHTAEPSSQLVVMGRFALNSERDLRLWTDLFGHAEAEQRLQIAARRGADSRVLTLTPERPEGALFPSAGSVAAGGVGFGGELSFIIMLALAALWLATRHWDIGVFRSKLRPRGRCEGEMKDAGTGQHP